MAMSRKHYVQFADMLADQRRWADSRETHLTLDAVTTNMATIFGRDNGSFDRQRFYTAAGYDSAAAEAARVEPVARTLDPELARRAY